MDIQLIQGEFSSKDALALITKMIHVKIKYHEDKISDNTSVEDIKSRESKIKRLQKELFELRETFISNDRNFNVNAIIKIN